MHEYLITPDSGYSWRINAASVVLDSEAGVYAFKDEAGETIAWVSQSETKYVVLASAVISQPRVTR
jgi:hypothetical protein